MSGKKKAVLIGASAEALHTIKIAQDNGLFVTALDGNKDALGLACADKGLVVDISDEKAVVEVVREEAPDFLLTVPIGRYLTTIGAVNDALLLPGISKRVAECCTDKLLFHEKLFEKGLRSCRCYAAERLSGKEEISFPAILKPRFGSGSRGIFVVSSHEELQRVLPRILDEPYLLEECVEGEEYGVDGAVIRGVFYLILLRKKVNTPFPARQAVAYFSLTEKDPFYQTVKLYMEEVIQTLGMDECLLHADIIRGKEAPFVIEMSARPSGHNLHNLFTPLCTGIDEAKEYICYRMGQPYSFEPKKTEQMMIHYFDGEGKVLKVPKEDEIRQLLLEQRPGITLKAYNCCMKEGEILKPVSDGKSVMGRGYFILAMEKREGEEKAEKPQTEVEEEFLAAAERIKNAFF